MKNKKALFIILNIIIVIIVFIVSFIVGIQLLNIFENTRDEKMTNDKQEVENIQSSISAPKQVNSFDGIIISMEGRNIGVENPSHLVDYSIYESDIKWHNEHQVVVNDKLCVTASYLLCLDNVDIKDRNGNKISVLDLKVGDNITVFTQDIKYNVSTIFKPITSEHIKLIEKK